ncbi:MAG: dethiobiotin synthase, partial [Betaproteobacteria bacterium]
RSKGLRLAAWVANRIDPSMHAFDETLSALETRLGAPLLGVVPCLVKADPSSVAEFVDLNVLDFAES